MILLFLASPEPRLLQQLRDEGRPAGLRAGPEALSRVAVEVLVERDVIPEVRAPLERVPRPVRGAMAAPVTGLNACETPMVFTGAAMVPAFVS